MGFWEYERIRHAQVVWKTVRKEEPPSEKATKYTQPLSPDEGPQFIDEDEEA